MIQVEYKGVVYKSLTELACALGISYRLLLLRLKLSWPLERAITAPVRRRSPPTPCKDHLGNEHANLSAMAKAWGMGAEVLRARLSTGWDLEAALTVQPEDVRKCKDHLGNEYPTFNAMAKAWGVNVCTLAGRLERGWSPEKALTAKPLFVSFPKGKPCKDHLGNEYKSVKAMALAWGVSRSVLTARLSKSWDLESALTTPARLRRSHRRYKY
jgi:hypothetical protein